MAPATAREPSHASIPAHAYIWEPAVSTAPGPSGDLTCVKRLRAAEAKRSMSRRRPAVAAAKTDTVRTAYLEGQSIADLALDHGVSRGAIRTASPIS